MNYLYSTVHYQWAYNAIQRYYGDRTAKRSGVPLMEHIKYGLGILDNLDADTDTCAAYCLHPMFQSDEALLEQSEVSDCRDPHVMMLVMEYRSKANAFLCRPETDHWGLNRLPTIPLQPVREMLIADKLQNFKDFCKYHKSTHPRSGELFAYFNKWLDHLNVDHGIRQEVLNDTKTI